MKKICKNCKYYTAPKDGLSIKRGQGDCNCDKFEYNVDIEDYPLNDRLEYWDSESYSAGFYVGENFGCIHFKKI